MTSLADVGIVSGAGPLVLGVARGGLPVAAVIATTLEVELDVAVARKISAPGNPEFAIGAVTADGAPFLSTDVISALKIPAEWVASATDEARREAIRRTSVYRGGRSALDVAGRFVLVVDDGVATGSTLIAVLQSVDGAGATRVVCAVPVGPPETIHALGAHADLIVCPNTPRSFRAVGEWYDDFSQLDDADVMTLLESG